MYIPLSELILRKADGKVEGLRTIHSVMQNISIAIKRFLCEDWLTNLFWKLKNTFLLFSSGTHNTEDIWPFCVSLTLFQILEMGEELVFHLCDTDDYRLVIQFIKQYLQSPLKETDPRISPNYILSTLPIFTADIIPLHAWHRNQV